MRGVLGIKEAKNPCIYWDLNGKADDLTAFHKHHSTCLVEVGGSGAEAELCRPIMVLQQPRQEVLVAGSTSEIVRSGWVLEAFSGRASWRAVGSEVCKEESGDQAKGLGLNIEKNGAAMD